MEQPLRDIMFGIYVIRKNRNLQKEILTDSSEQSTNKTLLNFIVNTNCFI